ncbi:MAG: Ku protein [Chitinophagaceae bacterium]
MRPIWSGAISFGLVNVPVKLLSAVQSEDLNFDMLSKDNLSKIRYARIDTKTDKEVPWKEIVKGYEYTKGKYVVITDEDFKSASPEKSTSIDIVQFAKESEIDPIYYEKPYYIIPGKGAEKTYQLLLRAMEETKSVGIAEFMLRNRAHVCSIKPHDNVLMLNQMRYQEEVREAPEIETPKKDKISPKEVQLAVKLIEQLSEKFDPSAFKDTYVNELKKVIEAKAKGKKIHVAEPRKETTGNVKDLMEVLKQSLNTTKKTA